MPIGALPSPDVGPLRSPNGMLVRTAMTLNVGKESSQITQRIAGISPSCGLIPQPTSSSSTRATIRRIGAASLTNH